MAEIDKLTEQEPQKANGHVEDDSHRSETAAKPATSEPEPGHKMSAEEATEYVLREYAELYRRLA